MLRGQAEVERNIDLWYAGMYRGVIRAMENIAAHLEGYAKSNHPWTVRTGDTTRNIRGFISEATPVMVKVILRAGMPYNVFLELARGGKWAWLWPAIEANRDFIRRELEGIRLV